MVPNVVLCSQGQLQLPAPAMTVHTQRATTDTAEPFQVGMSLVCTRKAACASTRLAVVRCSSHVVAAGSSKDARRGDALKGHAEVATSVHAPADKYRGALHMTKLPQATDGKHAATAEVSMTAHHLG